MAGMMPAGRSRRARLAGPDRAAWTWVAVAVALASAGCAGSAGGDKESSSDRAAPASRKADTGPGGGNESQAATAESTAAIEPDSVPAAAAATRLNAPPRTDGAATAARTQIAAGAAQKIMDGRADVQVPPVQPRLEELSPEDQQLVARIEGLLATQGFSSLSHAELEFAARGVGRAFLLDKVREAAAEPSSGLEDKAARLLDLDANGKIAFKLIESPLEQARVLRLAEALVQRDRALDEEELQYARDSQWLSARLEDYLRLGLDQEKAAVRRRGERRGLEDEVESRQREMVELNRSIKAQSRSVAKLQARLNRQRRRAKDDRSRARLMELEQQVEQELAAVQATQSELDYSQQRLDEARRKLDRMDEPAADRLESATAE